MDWLLRLCKRFALGGAPVDELRWVMVDVETSRLDPHRARLLAIAAIAQCASWRDVQRLAALHRLLSRPD